MVNLRHSRIIMTLIHKQILYSFFISIRHLVFAPFSSALRDILLYKLENMVLLISHTATPDLGQVQYIVRFQMAAGKPQVVQPMSPKRFQIPWLVHLSELI